MSAFWWIVLSLVWLAGYALACWLWPFRRCPRCKGTGKRFSPSGKAFGNCWRCKGSGRRIRLGRRVTRWMTG